MERLGVAVVGVGNFGEKHVQVLSSLPHTRVVAVCGRVRSRAKLVAEKYGVRRWYTDLNDIVKQPDVRIVSVVTPEPQHVEPTIAAAEAGKDIFLEKPIATSLEDADKILNTIRRTGVKFMVGHILRFEPRYARLKEEVERGTLGKIVSMSTWRRGPESIASTYLTRVHPALTSGVHDIDMMLWLTEDRVSRVYSENANTLHFKFPNFSWILLKFKGGAIGVAENTLGLTEPTPFEIDSGIEVMGTRGSARIDLSDHGIAIASSDGWKYPDATFWPMVRGETLGALKEELNYFVRAVLNDEQPKVIRPEEAREALRVALAAVESAKKNVPLSL